MCKVIAICNQKGGVAKTATTHQLAAGLARSGHKSLIIDLDPQFNLTSCVGLNAKTLETGCCTIYDVLSKKRNFGDAVQEIKPGLSVVAGTWKLVQADKEFAPAEAPYLLKKFLQAFLKTNNFDFVLIDTPPTIGVLTYQALTAADYLVVPYKADALTGAGILQLMEIFEEVREFTNPNLQLLGILLTMFDSRTNISKQAIEDASAAAAQFKTRIFSTRIRQSAAMRELPNYRTDIFEYASTSPVANDYQAFVTEFLEVV